MKPREVNVSERQSACKQRMVIAFFSTNFKAFLILYYLVLPILFSRALNVCHHADVMLDIENNRDIGMFCRFYSKYGAHHKHASAAC